ncbi:MAG: helix-turn-helix domain-containing protein [Candidatus Woesearchaeota archaeon]
MEKELVKEAGLTDGEAKVYLALLELGASTTGPVIEKSGVARSFIYNILEKLTEKGLVSYVVREKTKNYQACSPERILDYIEERKQKLDESKEKMQKLLPKLNALQESAPFAEIHVYEGLRGLQTAFEQYHKRLKKGEEALTLGAPSYQEEKYHEYWQQDHILRGKEGIKNRMLFNMGTDPSTVKNRNSYKGCTARYMNSNVQTPAWILVYKDISQIYLQDKKKPIVVEIKNKQIAQTFEVYFEDYWKKSKKF